ncbi:hypothetical protein [Rubrobacter radiotolerans]|uniref:Sigma-70, region 4 n=1 Tax=Rubrobacter radiotolerans TaxID=42256 RepID=A0AB35T6G6_RUBRA|nr:hypothetical protein [Rubrobacter radiotolerans]MDX5895285.1 hypothetical protein [Rubrobacter radiotolerans]SMC01980.1 RNA polymerase, sigma-24 subunit, ECF subfamily [Rubrobacter radiotolerans DSM 5868]
MGGETDIRRKRLEELKELFGPAFGPAVEAYGRSLAERLLQDEGLAAEIRERFEQGRASGKFPALSELLAGKTNEEVEEFFRAGWAREILPRSESISRRPWDYPPWNGDMESYREDLYAGIAFGLPDFRAFAQEWLEELARVGYYGMEESLGLPLKQQAEDFSSPPKPLPLYGEAYPVRLGDTGQTVWLDLDGPRSERGYREIVVSEEPLRTDKAILAALTALEGRPLDIGRLREVLPEIVPSYGESVWDRWTKAIKQRHTGKVLRELRHHQALDYVLSLLRYHHPDFDALPIDERIDLIAETCAHVNEFLEGLRKLVAFLEHRSPGRRGPASTRVAARDIKAAILKDVDGLTYREIGEELCIPIPADFLYKGDHPTVRKMVGRGRKALEGALGKEGWQTQIEAMRAEAERWRSLTPVQREAEDEAEALDIPYEDALQRVEEKQDGSDGESGIA